MGVRCGDIGDPEVTERTVRGEFSTHAGSRGLLGVVASDAEPLYLPAPSEIDNRIDRTTGSWRSWSDGVRWDGPWAHAVRRTWTRSSPSPVPTGYSAR
jgi:hypothetical protein